MKLLLIQVENDVRDLVCKLIQHNELPITRIIDANHSQLALTLLQHENPQLILLPLDCIGFDGLTFLEQIVECCPQSKTIMIIRNIDNQNTSEFERKQLLQVMRDTTLYAGTDYIQQPIDADQLSLSLRHAITRWQTENDLRQVTMQRAMEINQMRAVYWDKLLSNFVDEAKHENTIRYLLEHQFALPQQTSHAQVAVCSLEQNISNLLDRFAHDFDLICFTVLNVCNEWMSYSRSGISFRHLRNHRDIVLIFWKPEHEVKSILLNIHHSLHYFVHFVADFGLGKPQAFPARLHDSYQEAKFALKQRNLVERTSCIQTLQIESSLHALRNLFWAYSERLKIAIYSGQRHQIETVIDEWISKASYQHLINPLQLEQWWIVFQNFRYTWIQENLPAFLEQLQHKHIDSEADVLRLPLNDQGLLCLTTWKSQLVSELFELTESIRLIRHKQHKVMDEICSYIERNYNKPLNLQDISKKFYMSREYISRKFKQERKVNFSEYVSHLRIEKSKALLMNPDLRIAQIAEHVGYPDEKYFSKVFKKVTGISPKSFRKQHQ